MILPYRQCIISWMAIYFGGKIRIDLPHSISSTPLTLHTLFASWAGMQYGPYAGSAGAAIHASIWILLHSTPHNLNNHCDEGNSLKRKRSWNSLLRSSRKAPTALGYILGMVPCAALAGGTVEGKERNRNLNISLHPIAASAIGQMMALFMGTVWIHLSECRSEKDCGAKTLLWKRNFVPFLPGLIIKSILSWALFELSRDF